MQLIFTGLLFIYANFYSSFFKMIFGFNLLPYFVGYIIIYKGLFELMEESSHFQQMLPVAQVMTVVMAAVYAMNALSINSSDTILVMITWGGNTLYYLPCDLWNFGYGGFKKHRSLWRKTVFKVESMGCFYLFTCHIFNLARNILVLSYGNRNRQPCLCIRLTSL